MLISRLAIAIIRIINEKSPFRKKLFIILLQPILRCNVKVVRLFYINKSQPVLQFPTFRQTIGMLRRTYKSLNERICKCFLLFSLVILKVLQRPTETYIWIKGRFVQPIFVSEIEGRRNAHTEHKTIVALIAIAYIAKHEIAKEIAC